MIEIHKQEFSEIPGGLYRLTFMGDVTSAVGMTRWPVAPPCKKIDADRYFDKRTGEIKEYKKSSNRGDNHDSLRKTFRKIRDLINTNLEKTENARWVTLTYAENMTDNKRLYRDYSAFWKRFKRYCEKEKLGIPEYITVVEPQGRGAWHVHAFFIWNEQAPFIPNEKLREIWGYGFVNIKAVNDVTNIGAYFSAYLADIPIEEYQGDLAGMSVKTVKTSQGEKRFIKGGRMILYPPGMNLYRKSRGIKEPEVIDMDYGDYKKIKVGLGCPTYKEKFIMCDSLSPDKIINSVTRIFYSKRIKNARVEPER